MDIGSENNYPGSHLSNFHGYRFEFDGVRCNSMEGLLQAFKTSNEQMQAHICTLVGIGAKRAGNKGWKRTQTLWWKGVAYKRDSKEYQELIARAYDALFTNEHFRKALAATGDNTLTHNIGRDKETETCLTKREFISQLYRLRRML